MGISTANPSYAAVLDSPVGKIGIRLHGNVLIAIDMLPPSTRVHRPVTSVGQRIVQQLTAYFEGQRAVFNLQVQPTGTPFQLTVWDALLDIPVGATLTYGALAKRLHTSARAVGNACRANPIPIIVPCHRVVAVNGIGGYAGATSGPELQRKRWLLEHESHQRAPADMAS